MLLCPHSVVMLTRTTGALAHKSCAWDKLHTRAHTSMNSPFEIITLIKHLGGKIRALSFKYDKVILGRGKVVSEVKGQVKVQLKMIKIIRFFLTFFNLMDTQERKTYYTTQNEFMKVCIVSWGSYKPILIIIFFYRIIIFYLTFPSNFTIRQCVLRLSACFQLKFVMTLDGKKLSSALYFGGEVRPVVAVKWCAGGALKISLRRDSVTEEWLPHRKHKSVFTVCLFSVRRSGGLACL